MTPIMCAHGIGDAGSCRLCGMLGIATDILRELGMEDVARWVEHPEHVRRYLKHTPVSGDETEDGACSGCRVEEARGRTHLRDCWVTAAWRALGDPRGQADIERAHEEALYADSQRANAAVRGRRQFRGSIPLPTAIHWLSRAHEGNLPGSTLTPGWVDRAAFPAIPDDAFDFSRDFYAE